MVEIDKNASKVAITTDLWTANNSRRPFMVITAHYISDSWTLESRVIRYFFSLSQFVVLVFRFLDKLINFLLSLVNHIYVYFF